MSQQWLLIFIGLGIGVALLLLVIVLRQYRALQRAKRANYQRQAELSKQVEKKRQYQYDSLLILSQALSEGQVGQVEGAIRITALLSDFAPELLQREPFQVLAEVSRATEHIPILTAWKALDKPTRNKHLVFMEELEQHQGEAVIRAGQALLTELNNRSRSV